ncbi:cytochrome bc complex cytochrome b subunit [Micrococcaceae bacterium Sec6.3]
MSTAVKEFQPATSTGRVANFVDTRMGMSPIVKFFGRKIFPDHWTFMFGEVALYSFVILLLSGAFLTFFFDPSMSHVTYDGAYAPMRGIEMSAAYASALDISFDIRGGLFMRQLHHWAALLFVASMSVHMLRIFFTGAFRRPRELNWVVGCFLLMAGWAAGFTGYSLPDDVLSGNGLRIIDGILKALPLVGSYLSAFLFGGEFPGYSVIGRLYALHIMIVPAVILLLIAVHLFMVVVHKHTQYPGPGRTENNVVGYPVGPVYAAKAGGFFFIVFGVLALIAGTVTINAIWTYGPYDPSPVSAGTQPDWYIGPFDGALRLMPGMLGDYSFLWNVPMPWGSSVSLPMGVLAPLIPVGVILVGLILWPWIERWITRDDREHHILDRPRNAPARTAFGVAVMTMWCTMWAAASSDLIATHFHLSLNDVAYFLRALFFLGPVVAYLITRRVCLSLQRKDRETVLHGHEAGVIEMSPDGGFHERHRQLTDYEMYRMVAFDEHRPVPATPGRNGKVSGMEKMRSGLNRAFYQDRVAPVSRAELVEARLHGGHGDADQIEGAEHDGGANPEISR